MADRRRARRHLSRLLTTSALAAGLVLVPPAGRPGPPALLSREAVPGASAAAAGVEPPSRGPVDRRPATASWPLRPEPGVLRPFDAPAQRWSPGHRGVDLAASAGQAVLAPAAGTVTFAGVVVDRGVLTLTHSGGLRSSFEPVTGQVPVGTVVAQGQPVAAVDPLVAHCAPVTCLHWGVRRGEVYLDPLGLVLPPPPSVLLPLTGRPRTATARAPGRGPAASGDVVRRVGLPRVGQAVAR